MGAKLHGDRVGVQPLQGVADGGVGRCLPPPAAEGFVEPRLVGAHELVDAPVRSRPADDGQNAEQEHVGQVVHPPLGTAVVGDWE